ncbi:MAG TPA: hypothetical protein HPP77_04810, partial [Candidatus Hydrogenedentes bacterium]|nr:hypothetical protein [Candidatus Hydrogenedentota bacterium]
MAREFTELSAYLDGELDDAQRSAVEARLASDAEYARELERLERIRTMLGVCIEQPGFHTKL